MTAARITPALVLAAWWVALLAGRAVADEPRIRFRTDAKRGIWTVTIDGRPALTYHFGPDHDLPHYQVHSPSGRTMLVPLTEPYPHHRGFWFADTVRLEGARKVSFYNAYYSGTALAKGSAEARGLARAHRAPFKDHIRHVAIDRQDARGDTARVEKRLVWEMDGDRPVLDEQRTLRIRALGRGSYFLDLTFTLTARHGAVTFVSDAVHYAWPYLRMNDAFNGAHGGVITNDRGAVGQKGTNLKPARWIDYSHRGGSAAEGLALLQWPASSEVRWLTREYGTFGPRRTDDRSGKPFTLARSDSLVQRVGVLVHRGDVKTGRVAEHYRRWIEGDRKSGRMAWTENAKAGTMTLRDGERPVLVYRFGDQLAVGVDRKYARSGYVHPLHGLDGEVLTDDFPADHPHHRGVAWTWPKVRVRGRDVQTWHPSPLRQHFARWLAREAPPDRPAVLRVRNAWKLDATEVVAHETVTLRVHPVRAGGRAIDVTLEIEAVGGPLQLRGADRKGYGGFCLRGARSLKGAALTTDRGPLEKDSTNVAFHWADIAAADHGVTVMPHPDHPAFPPTWLLRNTYAGILNVSWPGLKPVTLEPDRPVTLAYRLWIHRGKSGRTDPAAAYRAWLAETAR